MTPAHRFEIGSVMKSFRWVLMHKLAEEGSLRLEDRVNDHLPFPNLPGVTIRDLMHHASGMIDVTEVPGFWSLIAADPTHEYSYRDSIELLVGVDGAVDFGATVVDGVIEGFRVGTDSHYSSFGPVIADEIARSITGRNARELAREEILTPLDLRSTSHVFYEPRPAGLAQGYESPGRPRDLEYADTAAVSSLVNGLMYSSACDLLH